jgi:hypothetical protein
MLMQISSTSQEYTKQKQKEASRVGSWASGLEEKGKDLLKNL